MTQVGNIIYQRMEYRYLESLVDCIGEAEMQENAFLQKMDMNRSELQNIFQQFLQDKETYERIIIAIDRSNNDRVVGYIVGEDLIDVLEEIKDKQDHSVIEQYCEIQRMILKPLVSQGVSQGEMILVDSFGVRQGYQQLKVGQEIFKQYILNSIQLGYKAFTGLCYNRASIHIAKKFGAINSSELTTQDLTNIVDPITASRFKEGIELPIVNLEKAQAISLQMNK